MIYYVRALCCGKFISETKQHVPNLSNTLTLNDTTGLVYNENLYGTLYYVLKKIEPER